ncbi:oxidoreductase [Streptomyces sp. NPDC050504]|uniref:oxidoreductase n=1 Tax=Streptomyces sp. NPDC050504 TaxID=3365618 RepID=UPI0037A25401
MILPWDGDDAAPQDLTPVERRMWQAFKAGETLDLRTGDPVLDDPFSARPWPDGHSVRALTVARLMLDGPPADSGKVSAVKLRGARITGRLDVAGGTVAPYVEFTGCRFDEEVVMPETRFTTLRMASCALPRFEGSRLHTEGDLHLPRCRVARGIRLNDAHIGTDLLLNQIDIRPSRRGQAVTADGLTVAQDLQAELIEAYGEVSLRGAKVGGSLSLRGSRLRASDGRRALNAPQLTVERTLYMTGAALGEDFARAGATPPYGIGNAITPARGTPRARTRPLECRGGVRLDDGRFGDAVDFLESRFVLAPGEELSLRRIVTPELRFVGERPEEGRVVLNGAKVVTLVDLEPSWPGPGGLAMGGFVYENLVPYGHFPLSRRLDWVAAATPEFNPEPYERLAAVLRASGEDADAREVLLAKQRRRRETLPPAAKLWGYVQDWTVAYGYKPGRAAVWMAVLWAAGAVAFSQYDPGTPMGGGQPERSAPLYALDLLIPVIDLGQEAYWRLDGGWQWLSTALILLGWILATTVAAGASRLLRRS